MSVEYSKTLEFIQQLAKTGMERKDIASRAYNFSYTLCQQREEMRMPRGSGELSSALKVQCMDIAADILKDAMEAWDPPSEREGDPMLPAGEWEALASVQRNDIYSMKDRMVRHLNAEVESFYRDHPELRIYYRFQVEAVLRSNNHGR